MNETERIEKMVEAGTITGAEAERLLSVLREIDAADGEIAATGEAMEAEARRVAAAGTAAGTAAAGTATGAERPEHTTPATPAPGTSAPEAGSPESGAPETGSSQAGATATGAPAGAAATGAPSHAPATSGATAAKRPAGTAASAPAETASAPEGTRWVHVTMLAGDLTLRADPDVHEVMVHGDTEGLRVEPTADGFAVRHLTDDRRESWVDRFLSRIRSGHVELRVPAGYGVDLNVTAGDVDLHDIPYLRGRLTSGDLDARGLRGIDFSTAAGDLDLAMTLTEGRHNLRATAGDVNVRLGADSDVTVKGSVSIGSASVRAPGFDSDHRGLGQRFDGRIGDGAATLEVHVTTGDVDVRVDDER